MIVNLKDIMYSFGESKSFKYALDLSNYKFLNYYPFDEPLDVKAFFRNDLGKIILSLDISFNMSIICDKCLCNFSRHFDFSSTFNILDYIKENDSILEIDKLDLDEIVCSHVILELPSRFVCSENCKGLCHTCGCNLNIDNCGC